MVMKPKSKFATKVNAKIPFGADSKRLQEAAYKRFLAERDHGALGRSLVGIKLSCAIEIPGPSIETWRAWCDYAKSPKGERSIAPYAGRKADDVVRQRPDQPNIVSTHGQVAFVWKSTGLVCFQVYETSDTTFPPLVFGSYASEERVASTIQAEFAKHVKAKEDEKKIDEACAVVTWKTNRIKWRLWEVLPADAPKVTRPNYSDRRKDKFGYVVNSEQLEKAKAAGATVSRYAPSLWEQCEPFFRNVA